MKTQIITLLTSAIIFIFSLSICIRAWTNRQTYFREQFSLRLTILALFFILFLLLSAIFGIMPWSLPKLVAANVSDAKNSTSEPTFSDYALLIVAGVLSVDLIRRIHEKWTGARSLEQYRREQRNESLEFQSEGLLELRRILTRQPALKPHTEQTGKHLLSQLQPPSGQQISWRDRARDLIRLSSSAYNFDKDSGWRDTESCWVGRNLDNERLVLLHPAHSVPTEERLAALSRYAADLREETTSGKRNPEIIIALIGNTPIPEEYYYESVSIKTEEMLLKSLVDFSDYRNEVRRRVMLVNLPETELSISDTYVTSEVITGDSPSTKVSTESHIIEWLKDPGQRQLALLGEYGQGKSTATLMFTFRSLFAEDMSIDRIPILIELRGTSPRNLDPLGLLGAWGAKYNINAQALMQLHWAGQLLLIFEGFDEMALVGDAEMRLRHFKTLWDFCHTKAKIIITGRPNFFLDEEEMKAALGISKPLGDRPYCEALRLAPFAVEQIRLALRAQKEEVREAICALAEKNPRFLELVARPSLLHIVSVLWEKENLSSRVNQLTSAYLMDLFIRFSYRRQGRKEEDSPDFSALTTLERAYFMSGIATYMATKNLPNQITGSRLNECIDLLIESIPDSVSRQTDTISGEIRIPLRFRIEEKEFGREHVKTDVRACGLLVDDPAALGTFRFGHKSFLEYLFAEVVAERIRNSSREAPHAIFKSVGGKVEDVLDWPVALEFVAELLDDPTTENLDDHENRTGRAQAIRLFSTVFAANNGFMLILQRIQAFIAKMTMSVRGRMIYILATSLPMAVATFIMAYYISQSSQHANQFDRTEPRFLSIFFPFSFLTSVLFTLLLSRTHPTRRRLLLWESLCHASKIEDDILEEIIWASFVPRTMKYPDTAKIKENSNKNGLE